MTEEGLTALSVLPVKKNLPFRSAKKL